jgi:TatD DNase family protein
MLHPMFIDAHCHLSHEDWGNSLPEALKRAIAAGVGEWVGGGISPEEWKKQRELAAWPELRGRFRQVIGLHPWWVATHSRAEVESGLAELKKELGSAVAVGELGLDLHFYPDQHEQQFFAFERQLELAASSHKPLVLHVVKAHAEVLGELKKRAPAWRGIVHRFSGKEREAEAYLQLGLTLSVGGPAVLKQRQSHEKLWRAIPADRLVLETDAPWKNSAVPLEEQLAFLKSIAAAIGEARGETADEMLAKSRRNLEQLYA